MARGSGTHGAGNDTITAGIVGYRTDFDKGGTDTIDLSMYSSGAYLNMGVNITGAGHLVGVIMGLDDAYNTIVVAGNPTSLRWLYGEYENASGSSAGDLIIGNTLSNVIGAGGGDDEITGGAGNDAIYGGVGSDTAHFGGSRSGYTLSWASSYWQVSGADGVDQLYDVEYAKFNDQLLDL